MDSVDQYKQVEDTAVAAFFTNELIYMQQSSKVPRKHMGRDSIAIKHMYLTAS